MKSPYESFNFCIPYEIKYPKSTVRCSQCGNKIRTTARNSWKSKTKMKFICSNCSHIYGECVCCMADENLDT